MQAIMCRRKNGKTVVLTEITARFFHAAGDGYTTVRAYIRTAVGIGHIGSNGTTKTIKCAVGDVLHLIVAAQNPNSGIYCYIKVDGKTVLAAPGTYEYEVTGPANITCRERYDYDYSGYYGTIEVTTQ